MLSRHPSIPTRRPTGASIAFALVGAGCQTQSPPSRDRAEAPGIELRDHHGVVVARVVAGRPCRARVDGVELQVGGPPLIAQHGAARWTGEHDASGTTLRRDAAPIARIHARQLFDGEGTPVLRVHANGDLGDAHGAIVGRATATADGVAITTQYGTMIVTGTNDVVLAAMLAARDASPEVRALAACHFLLSSEEAS